MAVCNVCFRKCRLAEGQAGPCGARIGRDGEVRPLWYGKVSSLALDPIEKKPLYRFHPGSRILSVGSLGCNLHCPFCQNSSMISSSFLLSLFICFKSIDVANIRLFFIVE